MKKSREKLAMLMPEFVLERINTFEVSGIFLKELIANNTKMRVMKSKGGGSLEMVQIAGLSYTYDSKKILEGNPDFLVSVIVAGNQVEDNKTYKIATNNYITAQLRKFFGDVSQMPEFIDTGLIDRDVIIEAVEMQKTLIPLPKKE